MTQGACSATTREGRPCSAPVLPGGQFCIFHDPTRRERVAQGRRAGGAGKSNAARAAKRIPADIQDVLTDLYETLAELRAGTIPKGRATEIASVARAIVAAYEVGAVESRVERIESLLEEDMA